MDPYTVLYIVGLPAGACLLWCYETYAEYREHRKIIKREKENGWKYIGKVAFMCIYPIDGGRALKEEQAYIGQFGIRTDPVDMKACYDRGYILYKKSDRSTAILDDPTLSRKSNRYPEVNQLWNLLKTISASLCPNVKQVGIKYLDGTMMVRDTGDLISKQVRSAYNFQDETIRLAYYPQDYRKTFNKNTRTKLLNGNNGNCRLINYASLTMVNSASIADLRKESGRRDLSYRNFRPQIVFNGIRSYVEDGAIAVKIGDLEFTDITPCVYRDDVNLRFKAKKPTNRLTRFFVGQGDEREVQYTQPLRYLQGHRRLGMIDPDFENAVQPSFGLNFQCDTEREDLRNADGLIHDDLDEDTPNVIRKGYPVFVKY